MKNINKKIGNIFSKIFVYHEKTKYDFSLPEKEEELSSNEGSANEISVEKKNIFPTLQVNLEY